MRTDRTVQTCFAQTWFPFQRPRPLSEIRLFCLPFAGGSALLYRDWSALLPRSIEIYPVQLPGRMARLNEPAFDDAYCAADALTNILACYQDKPYALFGHSMGALLCYEISRSMQRRNLPLPVRLFLSAHRAPDLAACEPPFYDLDEAVLLARVQQFGGPALRLADNPELIQMVVPTLRADLKLCQTYLYQTNRFRLPLPMTLFAGDNDLLAPPDSVWRWSMQTSQDVSRHLITGDHFFLQTQARYITNIISGHLAAFDFSQNSAL